MRAWLAKFRHLDERKLLFAAVLALGVACAALYVATRPQRHRMTMTAGDLRGHRSAIANILIELAEPHGLDITLVGTGGSADAVAHVADRSIDIALIQGGIAAPDTVREVAPLSLEPLHLLVRGEIWDLEDLSGMRIQLAPPGSGTRLLALDVLELAGLSRASGNVFTEVSHTYAELEALEDAELPDAIFHVSSLPSPNARAWMRQRGYRLLPLPIADAMRLRNVGVMPAVIPAFAYGASPATPAEPVSTIATRMLVVAHHDVDPAAIRVLLDALDSELFASEAHMPRAERRVLWDDAELPIHAGTRAWLDRDNPIFTAEQMEGIESLRSFLVSLVVAGYLLFRWYRARKIHGLDGFLAEVSVLDRKVLDVERSAQLDLHRLLELRAQLGEVKARALDAFAKGNIHSEELLSSFLTHVSDVRSHLNAMILSERERLQKKARTREPQAEESVMNELWRDALDEEHQDRAPRVMRSTSLRGEPANTAKKDDDEDELE
jgi:TRAP transporter TAXI family solute receptor